MICYFTNSWIFTGGLERWQPSKTNGERTHFNPVDLAESKLPKRKFNLKDFVDPDSGFIVEKNTAGVNIKAYNYQVSGMELWLTG
jgi:hypothetical protein